MMTEEAPKKARKIRTSSWYSVTPNRLLATLGSLKGEINCDVCVIGGGFTGLSAALELSLRGYSVILLESEGIASSASGKNGGQLIRGYSPSPSKLASKFDPATARLMCDMTLEGLGLIIERITKYDIKCDLRFGHITAALDSGQVTDLKRDMDEWAKIGHTDIKFHGQQETRKFVRSDKYVGSLFDPKGAHIHPLNYALGLAQAAQSTGCRIYDESPVIRIEQGPAPKAITAHGTVTAKYLVLGGHVQAGGLEKLNKKVIAATAHMIATEPLEKELAAKLFPRNVAVSDASFIMNYFRLSNDNRLLFGGNCNYSGLDLPNQSGILKKRMVDVFPELSSIGIEHCWGGPLDLTINRLPSFGRLSSNVFYAHGFCGHGIILTNLAGKLIAEAISGTAERFDVFARIKHAPFIGGDTLKRPLFVLGMMWYRLRDLL